MFQSNESIMEAALAMPADERAVLMERLRLSLEDESARIEEEWIAEAERRLDEYDRGEVEAIPLEDVLRELRARKRP